MNAIVPVDVGLPRDAEWREKTAAACVRSALLQRLSYPSIGKTMTLRVSGHCKHAAR